MLAIALAAVLSAASPADRGGVSECAQSCVAHVTARLRGPVCKVCLTWGGDRGGWVIALLRVRPSAHEQVDALAQDPDWQVRWGAVRVMARKRGMLETTLLAERLARAPEPDAVAMAVVAAHVLAARGQSSVGLVKMGRDGPAAAARLWSLRDAVRQQMELELFSGTAGSRARGLADLSAFLRRPPAKVALEVVASRPTDSDAEVAEALRALCEKRDVEVGAELVAVARPPDRPAMDRLLAVYARALDALRAELKRPEPSSRTAAALALRAYLPMSQRDLEAVLLEDEPAVAWAAARALAGPKASGVLRYVESNAQRWAAAEPPVPLPVRWVSLALRGNRGCRPALLPLAKAKSVGLRTAAVPALVPCALTRRDAAGAGVFDDLDPEVRIAAVKALDEVAWGTAVAQRVERSLKDPDGRVAAAGLQIFASRAPAVALATLRAGLKHPAAEVREAAVEALGRRGSTPDAAAIADLLSHDPSSRVRVAAAVALGGLGGAQAVSALADAASRDPDSHVQYVAKDSLRQLGFQR